MTAQLLMITIGPVQDFIAAARRSRDLWYGSHLLSELSRCVAREIANRGGELIFPAIPTNELEPCLTPTRPSGAPPLSVANIILAKVNGDEEAICELAMKVRGELQEFWTGIADCVKTNCRGLIAPRIDGAWREQIETFLEFSAAWARIADYPNYAEARKAVARVIAARKNLRDFEPWVNQRGSGTGIGVPKSSLDGARETVLVEDRNAANAKGLVKKYRIGEGEQLDAIGLVKRAGGESPESRARNELQFVPIVNVALAPWLAMAKAKRKNGLEKLIEQARAVGLARVTRDLPCVADFKFDASIFLENRLWPTFEEQGLLAGAGDPKEAAKLWGRDFVEPIVSIKEPYPYVACLVADGDSMGATIEAIGERGGEDGHRRFSSELARFADGARKIVEQRHLGSLIYSGADDVLAFLPLSRAVQCANELQHDFETVMKAACAGFGLEKLPTLSVGIGIGHVLEGMGDLLNLGRAAEKIAKGGRLSPKWRRRNALAVLVDKRSGGRRTWRAQWNTYVADSGPAGRLGEDARLLRDELSTRKVFEIAETLRAFPLPGKEKGDLWPEMLADEVRRSLKRADGSASGLKPESVGLELNGGSYKDRHSAVTDWIARLLIAKTFAEADPQPRRN